jgi:hypothetical protein
MTRRTSHGQIDMRDVSLKQLENMTKTFLYSLFALGIVLGPAQAHAQVATPATPAPAAAPAEPVAPLIAILGEEYRVELQVGAWVSMPSTVLFSDTETKSSTVNGATTTTVVTGSNVDFKNALGLKNQVFPEAHLTIRLAPKHKLRGEYIPIFYKQTISNLGAEFKFNGQTYLAGQTVESTLKWNEWHVAYEFDPLVVDRGYVGGMVAVSSLSLSGATANTAQSGTASVNIIMPGLGATGRYYVSGNTSVSGDFLYFYLPGSATSTHGHILQGGGYLTYNVNKHFGAQVGFRVFNTEHTWGSPLNTGSMTIPGPFVGGTAHF